MQAPPAADRRHRHAPPGEQLSSWPRIGRAQAHASHTDGQARFAHPHSTAKKACAKVQRVDDD